MQPGSATVKVGDKVSVGQKICESGEAGFCPTPHLHIQVRKSCARCGLSLVFLAECILFMHASI